MDNDLRFQWYVVALEQYADREGHCRVPALHVEVLEGMEVKLGSFVSYQRQRRRRLGGAISRSTDVANYDDRLSTAYDKFVERKVVLETVPGWEWGPLRPGPASKAIRNDEIQRQYQEGAQVKTLADQYDLSRQRIHQIVGPKPEYC